MPGEAIQRVLSRLDHVKETPSGWSAECPTHQDDSKDSLRLNEGADGRALVFCHAGCDFKAVLQRIGLEPRDLFSDDGRPVKKPNADRKIIQTYDYQDVDGKLLFQVVRFDPKDFRQRRPDGEGGWLWNLKGVRRPFPVYRLPELLKSDSSVLVFVVEGEKDADRLAGLGLLATTSPMGAGNTESADWRPLCNRHVIILTDNDKAGRQYAEDVAMRLQGIAAEVKILDLPGLGEKQDVSNWIDAGGTAEELRRLADDAPLAGVWVATNGSAIRNQRSACQEVTGASGPSPARAPRPWRPYPVHALPGRVGRFVDEAAAALGCDHSMVALPTVVGLGGAIGVARRLRIKKGWLEPATMWGAVIGRSASLKTPGQEAALRLHERIACELDKQNEKAREKFDEDAVIFDAELTRWKRKATKDGADKAGPPPATPKPLIQKALLYDDATTEGLIERLADNPRGGLLVAEELDGWASAFDCYRGGKAGPDRARWVRMHGARDVRINRKGKPTLVARRATCSVIGGIQPGIATRLFCQDNRASGLISRLLVAMPPPQPKRWSEAEVSEGAEKDMEDIVRSLVKLDFAPEEGPPALRFSSGAKRLFTEWYDEAGLAALEAADDDEASAWGKIESYAARFALTFELASAETPATVTEVSEAAMQSGIELARWHAHEAVRVLERLVGPPETPEQAKRRRVLEWITSRGGRVTAFELSDSGPREWRKKKPEAEALLDALADASELVRESNATGRPTTVYCLAWMGKPPVEPENGHVSRVSHPGQPEETPESQDLEHVRI